MMKLLSRLQAYCGFRKNSIPEKVLTYCMENKLTIATAESCTAGMIAATIGNMSGVSEIFSEGYVTYSNDAKERLLGVPHDILESHGAVSEETARAMAEGVCRRTGAHIGIAATGIAGPTGGTAEKPVGLVYIGVCFGDETSVKKCLFHGTRNHVRSMTVFTAFDEVGKRLKISIDK